MKLKKIITLFFALAILSSLVLPVCAGSKTYKLNLKILEYIDTDTTEEVDYKDDGLSRGFHNDVTGKDTICYDGCDVVIDVPHDFTFGDLREYLREHYDIDLNSVVFYLGASWGLHPEAQIGPSGTYCSDDTVIKDKLKKWFGKKSWDFDNGGAHLLIAYAYPPEMNMRERNNTENPSTGDDALSVVPVILLSLSAAYCFGRKKKTA